MKIKQKHPIDFAKSVTWLVVLGLIYYFNQFDNITAWIYFCLHGSYGIMWVMKSSIFPDKTWERKAGIPYTLFILFGLMLYWAPALIITMNNHEASLNVMIISIIMFSFGVFYHFTSDMQKYIYLKHNSGLITDGLWKQCRHPNYFGELLIYSSFLLLTIEADLWWIPISILSIFIIVIWLPGMRRIDKSLSRFDEHKSYKEKTAFIIPYIL